MTSSGVLLDTSFFLRLLNATDPLTDAAASWLQQLLRDQRPLYISTISVAEFCVQNPADLLPWRLLRLLPFNLPHAQRAGAFVAAGLPSRDPAEPRMLVPNDAKLFAQADQEAAIGYYLTSDQRSGRLYQGLVAAGLTPAFRFLTLQTPPADEFGQLALF